MSQLTTRIGSVYIPMIYNFRPSCLDENGVKRMIKTLSDLENVLVLLSRHGVEKAHLHMMLEGVSEVDGSGNEVDLTSKSVPITLRFFPKQVKYNISDTFKANDVDESDVSDDDLYHSS